MTTQHIALGLTQNEDGFFEGCDPRQIPTSVLEEIGHKATPVLGVLRAHCLDCSHSVSEVRRCTSVSCALWPYRMGTNPFRAERSEAQRAADQAAGDRLRAMRKTVIV
jgi:hypothetical protein